MLGSGDVNQNDGDDDGVDDTISDVRNPASNILRLPEGWTREVDPDSGHYYYANNETGESSWTLPGNRSHERNKSQSITFENPMEYLGRSHSDLHDLSSVDEDEESDIDVTSRNFSI